MIVLLTQSLQGYIMAIVGKQQLVKEIATQMNVKQDDANASLEAVLNSITSLLGKGDEIRLIGFGSFSILKRAERDGRNPQTGEKIKIKASKRPVFRAGKELKDAVNK